MNLSLSSRTLCALGRCLLVAFAALSGSAQDLRVTDPQLSADGIVTLSHAASTNAYYILYRGETLGSIAVPRDLQPGLLPIGVLTDRPPRPETAFYRVREVPLEQPLDSDGDGLNDAYELSFGSLFNALDPADGYADPDGDGYTNAEEVRLGLNPFVADPPRLTVVSTSPDPGETGVSVTRETILRFSRPLAEGTQLNSTHLRATAAGRSLLARVELSSDRRTATLFYLENLPASTRVRVTLEASNLRDTAGQPVDADGDGQAGGTLALDFETLTITPVARTAIKGRVFASELVGPGSVNQPLEGVTISVDGAEETIRAVTDADGNFTLNNCPAGRFFVHIDGRTAVGSQWPDGAYYPYVGKAWEALAGRADNLAGDEPPAERTGNIYLPRIAFGSLQPVSATEETVVTFPASVLATHPELAGVQLRVPANALFADNGARGGRVGIAPVPPDRLPSPLPGGLEFPLVITVQTDGPSNFDRPVPVLFPNLPDPTSGRLLQPGEKSALWSFNHDTGNWEIQGSMTVTLDGKYVGTDAGVGIRQPGWHGTRPGSLQRVPRVRIPQRPPNTPRPPRTGGGTGSGAGGGLDCDVAATGPFQAPALGGSGAEIPVNFQNFPETFATPDDRFRVTLESTDGVNSFVQIRDRDGRPVGPRQTLPGVNPPNQVTWEYAPDGNSLMAHYVTEELGGNSYRNVVGFSLSGDRAGDRVTNSRIVSNENPPLIQYSPNGKYLLYGGYDSGGNMLFNVADSQTGDLVTTIRQGNTSAGEKVVIGFSPDPADRTLIIAQNTGTPGNTRTDWEAVNLENGRRLTGSISSQPVRPGDFRFSPAGDTLSVYRNGPGGPETSLYSVSNMRLLGSGVSTGEPSVSARSDGYYIGNTRISENVAARNCGQVGATGRLQRQTAELEAEPEWVASLGSHHYLVFDRETGATVLRGEFEGGDPSPLNLILAPNRLYRILIARPETDESGSQLFLSGANGADVALPPVDLEGPGDDLDGDALSDLVENVLGTNPAHPDSDSDGIPDGVEVRNGTNPLDDRPVATGVIASQPLPAQALDICAFDNRAIVALGEAGVGVLNVFNGLAPTLVAQVETPGSAHQVACAGNLVAVADGAAGVALVDITTPAQAVLVRQIPVNPLGGGETRSVATAADLIFAGQSSGFVAVIEAATGVVIQRMELGGSVESLAIEGVTLYAVAGGRLWVLPFGTGVLDKRGSVEAAGGRLFVGNARAYVTIGRVAGNGGSGFRVFDVSNPDSPVAWGQEITTQSNWKQVVPTGSGYGLGVVGINPSENTGDDVYLYDLRNGANTFVTRLETPGVAKAASLFNGLGYVADGEAGLQVVNYVAYDSRKQAPTGQLVLSATNTATAGGYVVVRAEVEDDVQVRNVEFLLNGEFLVTDGNFPFEVVYRVPTNQIGASLTFSARVFDTGGNTVALTNAPALTVVPDEESPVVRIESPSSNARFFVGDDVPVTVTARDNTGVATVMVRVDGRPARTLRLTGIDYLLLDALPSGTHTIQAVAVDHSGREGVSELVTFAVWRQAISREYSVFNFGVEEKPQAISREYSVFNFGVEDKPSAISREYSVFNFGVEDQPSAISREYSVFNFGVEDRPQAISREYSVENQSTE